jgi:peptidyl-tRNA hydrolase
METELKESPVTSEVEELAEVINEWRDCGQGEVHGPASSSQEFSDIVNEWRDCGEAKA